MRGQTPACSALSAWGKIAVLGTTLGLLALATNPLGAQRSFEWHGYGQFRYARSSSTTGFSLRRGKLWVQGPVSRVSALNFKVQGIFRNGAAGAFVLQDFFAEWRGDFGRLRVGQMIPDFSLQRSQPDFLVPLVERAGVVDALIPGARTLARDIGAQISFGSGSAPLHVSMGIFNGSGANHLDGEEGDFLTTGRAVYTQALFEGVEATVGTSVAYRTTSGTDVGMISKAGGSFAGRDLRWGIEAHLVGEEWEIQGEYLEGHLEGEATHGFYVLGDYILSPEDQIVFSAEQLDVPGSDQSQDPWYIAGFNHFLEAARPSTTGQTRLPDGRNGSLPTKLMADVRVQPAAAGTKYGATLQLQFFLH